MIKPRGADQSEHGFLGSQNTQRVDISSPFVSALGTESVSRSTGCFGSQSVVFHALATFYGAFMSLVSMSSIFFLDCQRRFCVFKPSFTLFTIKEKGCGKKKLAK